MGESNTIVSAYTMYRHLQTYCSHPSICTMLCEKGASLISVIHDTRHNYESRKSIWSNTLNNRDAVWTFKMQINRTKAKTVGPGQPARIAQSNEHQVHNKFIAEKQPTHGGGESNPYRKDPRLFEE